MLVDMFFCKESKSGHEHQLTLIFKKLNLSLPGFEPGTFGLEIQRAIHCATRTMSYFCSFPVIVGIN